MISDLLLGLRLAVGGGRISGQALLRLCMTTLGVGLAVAILLPAASATTVADEQCRVTVQQWHESPSLEDAFLSGYGSDPRDPEVWRIELLREAIGTAVWA
ncbi:hypothetical protein [Saccharomonospora piscinae]|uniref:hypothetical protein n=1 Tax=Saccharomonospora piscinae TaxID=687388 RepID=UPI000466675A|nr:hypothetical protein [Saccharomonospora piscinae]